MNTHTDNSAYFEWLCSLVMADQPFNRSYRELCRRLHSINFYSIMSNDENRILDGKGLRMRYAREGGIQIDMQMPATVLEVMAALADRMDYIVSDGDSEPAIWIFFDSMLTSLGLHDFTDDAYLSMEWHGEEVWEKVRTMLERRYKPDGQGGLFHIPGCVYDLRRMELWYQMQVFMATFCPI